MVSDVSLPTRPLTVYFDGACPLCTREVNMIRRRALNGDISFVDIAASSFSATDVGISHSRLMAEIHGRLPDGELIRGVEVFRQMYARIGYAAPVTVSRIWGIRHLLELAYRIWAKNRLRLTGRCDEQACRVPAAQSPR